jgi:uncharacterized protein YjbJ (UPF0337 family)
MGKDDKLENEFDNAKGRAKEAAGHVTRNPRLEDEGKRDQTKAKVRNAGEHAKDAAREAKDAFKK